MSAELACQETPYELFSLESLFPDPEEEHTILAYKAYADPDKMYMHKAMKEPDAGEFKKLMRGDMDAQSASTAGNSSYTFHQTGWYKNEPSSPTSSDVTSIASFRGSLCNTNPD